MKIFKKILDRWRWAKDKSKELEEAAAKAAQDRAEEREWYEVRPGRVYANGWPYYSPAQHAQQQAQWNAYQQSAAWQYQQQQFNAEVAQSQRLIDALGSQAYQQPLTAEELQARKMAPLWRAWLGFAPTQAVTLGEAESAFKKLALQYHPDKGGDAEKMKNLNLARAWARKELTTDA